MSPAMGHKRWAIAEGYIPSWSNGPEPQFTSHETACLLNTSDEDARVTIIAYFSDREPAGPYRVIAPARRPRWGPGGAVPGNRAGPADAARALQRPRRPRAHTGRRRLCERHRVGRAY